MRRDADVRGRLEQRFQAVHEVLADRVELGVRDRPRLEVDALADANARLELGEVGDVVERPPQPGLEHDADVVEPRLAQLPVEPQRVVGRRRVLHVDPHEVAALGGVTNDGLEVPPAELVAELEPEPSELHRDVRVELVLADRLEDVVVRATISPAS